MKISKFQKFYSPLGKGRRSRPNQYLRSVDQAHTISLRGPKWDLHSERRRREFADGMDGWDGWDGRSNGSFIFLYTLWVYSSSICVPIYMFKVYHQHCYGFENLISSWGVDLWFSKSQFQHDFFKIVLKVRLFKNTDGHRQCFFFSRENQKNPWKRFFALFHVFFTGLKNSSRVLFLKISRVAKFFTGTFGDFFTG